METWEIQDKLQRIYKNLSNLHQFFCGDIKITISNRLKNSNGKIKWRGIKGHIWLVRIVMSKAVLDEFGWEVFEQTFRHEIAHAANAFFGGKDHDNNFKRLCRRFGGKMNTTIAGSEYADCASTKYVKVKPTIKYEYHCHCGLIKKMARRMNKTKRFSSNWRCGRCKTPLSTWKEIRV